MPAYDLFHISTEVADAWIVSGRDSCFDYAYGGTRRIHPDTSDRQVMTDLLRLMLYESHLKNVMINRSFEDGALAHLSHRLPPSLLVSRITGARCLFRPHDHELHGIMGDPHNRHFDDTLRTLFAAVGELLNDHAGRIKLTPDFGRFAGVSDLLFEFTPHVLGIRGERGGCGGKASYTTTGILAALGHLGVSDYADLPVTVIGSAGALGTGVAKYFTSNGFRDVKVADLSYVVDAPRTRFGSGESGPAVLPSEFGTFTNECLERGGLIVATTLGDELVNSDLASIPPGTLLLLAHNHALPSGRRGRAIVEDLHARGVTTIPGQVLTLGGALTTRLEWYSRQAGVGQFPKQLGHRTVAEVTVHLMERISTGGHAGSQAFYSQMCEYAHLDESSVEEAAAWS